MMGKSALCQPYNNGHDKCDGTLFPEGRCACPCHDRSGLDEAAKPTISCNGQPWEET